VNILHQTQLIQADVTDLRQISSWEHNCELQSISTAD